MTRGIVLACALAAAAVAAVVSVRACAAAPAQAPTATEAIKAAAAQPTVEWEAGTNYTVLAYPQATSVAPGKVEVSEVFWYGCGHCYALDPALEDWKKKKASYVEFVRIPVIWGPTHVQHARLYYTLQVLGRGDLHPAVFDAIHRDGNMLAAETDEQARAMHLAFLKQHGVTEKQFKAAYDSPQVLNDVRLAQKMTGRYEVASVPVVIVNGTYLTSVSQAGGTEQLLVLINDLAAREKRP
jgi:thiol:disulfide interchange protein DsbA